jgi:hypothetical protein
MAKFHRPLSTKKRGFQLLLSKGGSRERFHAQGKMNRKSENHQRHENGSPNKKFRRFTPFSRFVPLVRGEVAILFRRSIDPSKKPMQIFRTMKTKSLFSPLDRRKSVSLGDLSEATGIPIQTLRDQVNRGEIPGMFRGGKGRKWRIGRADAERWWQEMQQTAVS